MPIITDIDTSQADFQAGLLTDVEADAEGFLRLADTAVLSFDGENDVVDLPADIFNWMQSSAYTVEFNIYIPTDFTSEGQIFFPGDSDTWIGYNRNGDKKLYFHCYDGNAVKVFSDNALNDSVWHHVACIHSGGSMYMYIEGAEQADSGVSQGLPNSTNRNSGIGCDVGYNNLYFRGKINDLRVWNAVRTQQEIQDNMNKRLTGNEPGLVAYYPMTEGTGTTATDLAGSNDGTINGASWVNNEAFHFNGNRSSPQIDLSAVGEVERSLFEWVALLNNQTIIIETRTSLDGGSTWSDWQQAINGGEVPDLPQGTDVSNGLLECRQTLSTDDPSVTPQLDSLTLEVNSQKLHMDTLTPAITDTVLDMDISTQTTISPSISTGYELDSLVTTIKALQSGTWTNKPHPNIYIKEKGRWRSVKLKSKQSDGSWM